MPGAPNRPPGSPAAPPGTSATDSMDRRILRRLVPARIALSLDLWKGAPSAELLGPLEQAEAAYDRQDFREAESRLDALAVRLAEPRWPTLPEPFRQLRVGIPAPQPPQWDPEFVLSAEEKARRKAHREMETQLALARASVGWARQKGLDTSDLVAPLEAATDTQAHEGEPSEIAPLLDPLWEALRTRVPMPKPAVQRPAPPPAPDPPAHEEG